jgi:hypothetical protein
MQIAVCGYYFNSEFIKTLEDSKYDWFSICHKNPPQMDNDRYVVIPNVGLEFGAYAWYVVNKWKGDDTLLIHDDSGITIGALKLIEGLNRDQVFLFSSEEEAKANGYAHGRAIFCSKRMMQKMKEDQMPWFDEGNHGNVEPTAADKPNYHNSGIQTFKAYLLSLPKEYTVNKIAIVPGLKCGYRGRL